MPNANNRKSKIKVMLVEDSLLALTLLKRIFSSSSDIEVVGTATNGKKALELIPTLKPAVICTDLHMPVMDGLEFTREVMASYPRPILVVSASVEEGSSNVFKILEAGAVDVFLKPAVGLDSEFSRVAPELIQKVKILAGVRVFHKPRREEIPASASPSRVQPFTALHPSPRIVVIGASTGGPTALQRILTSLPASFPLPIVCIQHISAGFLPGLIDWLTSQCRMKIKIAQPGTLALPGTVYFPQEGAHLTFDGKGKFASSTEPPFEGHCPSVTVTMRSAVSCYGSTVVGVLLTGMGKDGAEGLKKISRAGGLTIAQDEESCVVFGMPKQAIELGAARYVMPLNAIADMLVRACKQ